jgi:type IV secretory pathway VirB4 component
MNKNNTPIIKPITTGIIQYHTKQSKYENAVTLPSRSIILGPSGSGKTVLLTNLILNVYKHCFQEFICFHRRLMLILYGYL